MLAANQHAFKSIKKCRTEHFLGNLVLLSDHTKDCNKIQDHFEGQEFVVVELLGKPNVYQIKPVSGVGLEQTVETIYSMFIVYMVFLTWK